MTPPPPDTIAVLLCAGRSSRMGDGVQKALLELAGEPVALRSARALLAAPGVRGLVVVCRAAERAALERALAPVAGEVVAWADGGAERADSVRAGVLAAPDCEILLVHDAARCLVRPGRVGEVAAAAREVGAALLAVRVRDTVKRSSDGRHVDDTLAREELWAAQTPQGARTELLRAAVRQAARDGFRPTDDAALIERYGGPGAQVRLVEGDDDNLKLTSPADLAIAAELLARRARG